MLYQPTQREIAAVIARSLEKHPGSKPLADRFQRAESILADIHRLIWDGESWHCESAGSEEMLYRLNFQACSCPDADRHRDLILGRPFCKHRLALLAYREIISDHIAARSLGTYNGSADLNRLRLAPNAGLLLYKTGALLYVTDYADRAPSPLCHTMFTARGTMPKAEIDLAVFATWLTKAQPVPSVVEAWRTYDRAIARGETTVDASMEADEALIAAFAGDDRW